MNRTFLIITLASMLIGQIASAQPEVEWDSFYLQRIEEGQRRSYCWDMIQTAEGGYALAGERQYPPVDERPGGSEALLVVTDSTGELLFQEEYKTESSRAQTFSTIIQTTDGGYLMDGYQMPYGHVVKTDDEGVVEWRRVYEEERIANFGGMTEAGDDTYMLAGRKYDESNIWLFRIDDEGEIFWSRSYGTEEGERGGNIIHTADGGFAVAGTATREETGYDGLLLKVDSEGEQEWLSTFGTELSEVTHHLTQTPDGGYAVAGHQTNRPPFGDQAYMGRFDADGELLWTRDLPGENCRSIKCSTLDGGFVLAGESGNLRRAPYLLHLDPDGEVLWQLDIYGDSWMGLTTVFELPDYSYITAGSAYRHLIEDQPDVDTFFLVKTTPDPLVDEPIELAATDSTLDFGEIWIDSVSILELKVYNAGLRYGDIDSIEVIEVFEVFSCSLDSVVRLFPRDTVALSVMFQPIADASYSGVLQLWVADEAIEIELSGSGIPYNSVEDELSLIPEAYALRAYPNPFNSTTTISFTLPRQETVTLRVYDLSGREVAELHSGLTLPGVHRATWDASGVSAGMYMARLEAGEYKQGVKMVVVK